MTCGISEYSRAEKNGQKCNENSKKSPFNNNAEKQGRFSNTSTAHIKPSRCI